MAAPLTVSVVVATRNRHEDIRRSVPTLLATDAEEVVVVDQSTDDLTSDVLAELGAFDDRRLRYVRSRERGVSRGRNAALDAASGDIVAFTDDDCTVPTSWAEAYRQLVAAEGYGLIFAPVLAPNDRDGLPGWIPEYRPAHLGQVPVDCDPVEAFGFTANMAVTREVVSKIGGFDVYLGPGSERALGGEDTDFAYRAFRTGVPVATVASNAVTHYGAREGEALDATRRSYLRGAGAMLDKHRRLGDRPARHRELLGLLDPLREALSNAARFRRPSGLGSAGSFARGVLTARVFYAIDRTAQVYVPRR
jgi:GT2 family glycosyltransferase